MLIFVLFVLVMLGAHQVGWGWAGVMAASFIILYTFGKVSQNKARRARSTPPS